MHLTRRTAILAGAGLLAYAEPAWSQNTAGAKRGGENWTSRPPLPFAVQEIYPAGHRGRIHIAGGLLGQGGRVVGVSNRHIAYDPKTGAVATLALLPAERHHPHAVDHNGRLYLLGGSARIPAQ